MSLIGECDAHRSIEAYLVERLHRGRGADKRVHFNAENPCLGEYELEV